MWTGAPGCYSALLDKLQKRICGTVSPLLAASLETFAHHRNVASLSLFCRYYFRRCSSEVAQLVPLLFSQGRSTCYSDKLYDFSVTIPRCYEDVYVNSFFSRTARTWNSLPREWFPLSDNLNGLCLELTPINYRLLLRRFPVYFNLFVPYTLSLYALNLYTLNSMPCSGCSALHGKNPN